MAKPTKGSIGSYSRGKLEKIIDERVDTSAAGSAFTTIAVSGQSNVVSDSATDTLTLVAGSNMTITTNAAGDSITFASSGGSSQTGVNAIEVDIKKEIAIGKVDMSSIKSEEFKGKVNNKLDKLKALRNRRKK